MARPGAYRSEKRKKELGRQQKQEKKRLRRLGKDSPSGSEGPEVSVGGEGAEGTQEELSGETEITETEGGEDEKKEI